MEIYANEICTFVANLRSVGTNVTDMHTHQHTHTHTHRYTHNDTDKAMAIIKSQINLIL